jgi:hypothetical protein
MSLTSVPVIFSNQNKLPRRIEQYRCPSSEMPQQTDYASGGPFLPDRLAPDLPIDDEDDLEEEDPWPDNPVIGAEELLRFFRVRELLQA